MVDLDKFDDFADRFAYDRGRYNADNFCEGFHELLSLLRDVNEDLEDHKEMMKTLMKEVDGLREDKELKERLKVQFP